MSVLTATRVLLTCTAVVVVSWLGVFILGLTAWDPHAGTQARGQFGDSFGTLSALFAGLAFVGAATAAFLQREQLKEHRRELQDMTAADALRTVDARFFHLLASHQAAINEVRLRTRGGGSVTGRQAIKRIADRLVRHFARERDRRAPGGRPNANRRADLEEWFGRFSDGAYEGGRRLPAPFGDIVAHLCRLTHHVLRFVDESGISPADKQFYVRVLRAHLSNPELVLLFYNCLSRDGYPEHHALADRYQLFANVRPESLADPHDVLLYESLQRFAPGPAVPASTPVA